VTDVELSDASGSVGLSPALGTGRTLAEASGSFGGLVPPATVAVSDSGEVFLLDVAAGALRRWDACECRFVTVPCFGATGSGARKLVRPRAIAIAHENIYVCDAGDAADPRTARVVVVALRGYTIRAIWRPPRGAAAMCNGAPSAPLAHPWTPVGIAFDRGGRALVADPVNGAVHRFTRWGQWQCHFTGLGAVAHVAVDCDDRIYVAVRGEEPNVRILDAEGRIVARDWRPEAVAGRFPSMPFSVDLEGNLDFGVPCGTFDRHGVRLVGTARPSLTSRHRAYALAGRYLSQPLDSRMHRCQWHRIVVRGLVPPGGSVRVSTHTAEVEQPADIIATMPAPQWDTGQRLRSLTRDGEWDCLVRSPGGRYLWLQLELEGDGTSTPEIDSVRIEFPRISLRRFLPAVFALDPTGADFTDRFLSIFDTTLRGIEHDLDQQARLFDPASAPAEPAPGATVDVLTWLASWVGLTLDRRWPLAKRRRLFKTATSVFDQRGTRAGLRRLLLAYLDMDVESVPCPTAERRSRCTPMALNCGDPPAPSRAWQPPPLILEHFQLRRWLFVGQGRLGNEAVLWGRHIVNRTHLGAGATLDRSQLIRTQDPYRDPFHVYASRFSVFVPASFATSPQRRKALETLLQLESPAHTCFQLEFVAPRFRIGTQSMIGYDTVVARPPAPITLRDATLGAASLVAPSGSGGPSMRLGGRTLVGMGTRLD
jgi:phage tail-like protein